ncbi:unnamed protein product [Cyclocybe aegerita]|uniref:Uncharacterized protein n=1 Tax=Cyclocybe aegerita TaxID=1973307 RepID=A0A8S0VX22_CYCAE|nr:unnamed protein product [Cyclocybe aegerita]
MLSFPRNVLTSLQPSQPRQSFDDILAAADLPPPGPDFFHARRALWLTPRVPLAQRPPSSARDKLQETLSHPHAVHSDAVWNNGLEKVWRGLASGGRLKNRLPMSLIIKIIYAAWLRDKTWPVGMEAPDSDQEQQQGQEQP